MLPYGVDEAIGGDGGDGAGDGSGPSPPPPPPNGRAPPPPPDGLLLSPLERARVFLDAVSGDQGRFDSHATPGLRAVSHDARRARLRCEMPFSRAVTNRYGGLHGGCAATLVDVVATAALAALGDRAGVSLSITAHYHRPVVPLGPAVKGGGGGSAPSSSSVATERDNDGGGDGEDSGTINSGTIIVCDAEVVKVGKHVAAVDVAIRTRRRRGGGGDEDEEEDDGGGGGDNDGKGKDGPLLVSGTHVKALVARSDVGALFDRAAAPGGRSRL